MYLMFKTLHVVAVVLFLGNIITGVMWKFHADRSGEPRLMAHALAGIIRSDRWFTMPGVVLILISGVAMAAIAGYSLFGTFWIWTSLALFGVSGLAFMLWVGPAQKRLYAIANAEPFDAAAYERLSRTWAAAGVIALLTPLFALALMVIKPLGLGG